LGTYSLKDGDNVTTKSTKVKDSPKSLLERIFSPLLRRLPTEWLVNILMSRYGVYLIVLTTLTKEEKKGGKDDGSVQFTQKGRLHWKGTKIQMLGMLMQTAEEIIPHFPDSEVPDNLDFGGLMSKDGDHE
jgi:hypothetical protein